MFEESQEKIPFAKIKRLVRLLGQSKNKDIRVSKEAVIGFSQATVKLIETIMEETMKGKDKGKTVKDSDIVACLNKYGKYEFLNALLGVENIQEGDGSVFQKETLN